MYVLDGKPLPYNSPFKHNGVSYPSNWLVLSTLEDREAIGIVEVPDPPYFDSRFYTGFDDQGNLIPRPLEDLTPEWKLITSQTANGILGPSDWYVVRESDNGAPIPSGIKTWRQEIRSACESKITTIDLSTTTDELANYITYVSPSGYMPTDYIYWPPFPSGIQ